MELLLLVFFCLLTGSEVTFGAENDAARGDVPQPSVMTLNQTDESAVLQCEVRGAFPKPELHWQDGAGKKLPADEPQESERGGLYDIILQLTVTKTDYYRCVATYGEDNHQTDAETYVLFPEEILDAANVTIKGATGAGLPGLISAVVPDGVKAALKARGHTAGEIVLIVLAFAGFVVLTVHKRRYRIINNCGDVKASQLSVRILNQTQRAAVLQCEVQGAFPKPELHWEDSDGNILPAPEPEVTERGGHYDIILRTTVTKTDYYRCVATYGEANHQTDAYIYVRFPAIKPSVRILEQRKHYAVLQCEVRGASLKPDLKWKGSDGNILPAPEPEVTERGGRCNIILQTTVTTTDIYRCVATYGEANHQTYAYIYVCFPAPTPPGNGPAGLTNGTGGGDVEAGLPLMTLNRNQTPN